MSGNRRDTAAIRQVGEEPPYLDVGTEVSAKYRGAFCEAKIKSVKKLVKCKVMHSKGNGSSTVTYDCIKGELKVGSDVEVKLPDSQEIMNGCLMKITDSSAYTVVFDDGDERTLKRTALCLKGEKHFNESETLDHLPLTDPENFGTPVMQQGKKARKGRRYSTSNDDGDEVEEKEDVCDEVLPARKKLLKSGENTYKVVLVEMTEKKKTITVPALVISSENNCKHGSPSKNSGLILVKSFKDGKCFEVHLKDVKDFSKEKALSLNASKGETSALKSAIASAIKFVETKKLPSDWNIEMMKQNEEVHKDSSESSEDEETDPEKDEFMDKLSKFLEDKGTPLQRYPVLGHRDLDLYKLYQIVLQMGGMDKVISWHDVYMKMDIPVVTTAAKYHIKNAYKKYLLDYEQEQLSLLAKKNEVKKSDKCSSRLQSTTSPREKTNLQAKVDLKKEIFELNDMSKDLKYKGRTRDRCRTKSTSPKLSPRSPASPKSLSASGSPGCLSPGKSKGVCDLAGKMNDVSKLVENKNPVVNEGVEDKQSVIKVESKLEGDENCGRGNKNVEVLSDDKEDVTIKKEGKKKEQERIEQEIEEKEVLIKEENEDVNKEEEGERGDSNMSHNGDDHAVDVVNSPSGTSNDSVEDDEGSENGKNDKTPDHGLTYKLNDRIDVRYGRGRNATVYQAKITAVDPKAEEGLFYSVHYYGWNSRHDEWIGNERIIGRGQKLTRTRNGNRPSLKTTVKPPVAAKPVAKKNGKNGNGGEKPVAKPTNGGRGRKRSPSPTPITPVKNGRNTKSRSEKADSLDLTLEVKQHRVTRQNSASTPVLGAAAPVPEIKSEVEDLQESDKKECEEEVASPVQSPATNTSEIVTNQPSPVSSEDNVPKFSPGKENKEGECEEDTSVVEQPPVIVADPEIAADAVTVTEEPKKCLKRSHDDEANENEAPPTKKTPTEDEKKVVAVALEKNPPEESAPKEVQQDVTIPGQKAPDNENIPDASTTTPDPDLTCSEQMETNCASPDPYTDEFQVHDGYFSGSGREETSTRLKDSSSSLEEPKLEKSSGGRRGKGRRDRKARAPSSQSSIEGGDCHNGTNDGTAMTYMVSPTWTPKYNFTEDLGELLKKEESSERIRLLQEKIKDIRKAYSELKSEVATIDRKRRRRQKRKREEELSAEESNTAGSPSRSPLSNTNTSTVGTSSTLTAAVECR